MPRVNWVLESYTLTFFWGSEFLFLATYFYLKSTCLFPGFTLKWGYILVSLGSLLSPSGFGLIHRVLGFRSSKFRVANPKLLLLEMTYTLHLRSFRILSLILRVPGSCLKLRLGVRV